MNAPEIVRSAVKVGSVTIHVRVAIADNETSEKAYVPIEVEPDYSYGQFADRVANAARRCLAGALREMADESGE